VIAVSKHTARETEDLLGVPAARIDVVYHGVDDCFRPLPRAQVEAYRLAHNLPSQFVLYVGTLEPRKNLERLLEAYGQVRGQGFRLVFAGGMGWGSSDLHEKVAELDLADEVIIAGYVPDEELPLLYNAATVLAYPSLYEGFGFPVVEALACGTAVLTSNSSSLPEASGDAALAVDPLDVDEMAQGLETLLTDTSLRHELRARGLAHANRFKWTVTAAETAQVYRHAAAQRNSS
jgi:glycosyltransferase involved in cell wall biosynthesis